ncbi:MAG: sigma-54-dependent Fis family transcriptional regulator, partial [SAR324 cluster bacterium]|nr:sigma-54-dependent Fis family transcriptional regulator [SAR324 cluster bacterium]
LAPLRERPDDIPLLINHFLRKFSAQEQKEVNGIALEARRKLRQYHWPGNVRELENMIYRAIVLSETSELRAEDFPLFSLPPPAGETPLPATQQELPGFAPPRGALSMQEIEIRAIREALDATGGNISRAAEALRIGRATLYRKLKKFGLPNS